MFPYFLIETQIVSFLSSFPMRECPLLVSDNAVRDRLKRVKTLKKTKTKTGRQTNRKNVIKIQIYKFSLYFLCLFSFFSLAGRELAWRFVEDNWDKLYTRYAGGLLFSRLIKVTFVIEKTAWKKISIIGGMNKIFSLSRLATLRRFRCRKAKLYGCLLFLDDHGFVCN